MALSADVKTTRYGTPDGHQMVSQPMGANVTVYAGSIALTITGTGYIKNAASPASTDTCWGIIAQQTINGSSAAALSVNIETGTFFVNAGADSDALTQADVGSKVYVIDEVTVGKTNGSGTRPVAGTLIKIDTSQPGGYAVRFGNAPPGTGSP